MRFLLANLEIFGANLEIFGANLEIFRKELFQRILKLEVLEIMGKFLVHFGNI